MAWVRLAACQLQQVGVDAEEFIGGVCSKLHDRYALQLPLSWRGVQQAAWWVCVAAAIRCKLVVARRKTTALLVCLVWWRLALLTWQPCQHTSADHAHFHGCAQVPPVQSTRSTPSWLPHPPALRPHHSMRVPSAWPMTHSMSSQRTCWDLQSEWEGRG